eukprot:5156732-Pyramimonas_sp.AAC.1
MARTGSEAEPVPHAVEIESDQTCEAEGACEGLVKLHSRSSPSCGAARASPRRWWRELTPRSAPDDLGLGL